LIKCKITGIGRKGEGVMGREGDGERGRRGMEEGARRKGKGKAIEEKRISNT